MGMHFHTGETFFTATVLCRALVFKGFTLLLSFLFVCLRLSVLTVLNFSLMMLESTFADFLLLLIVFDSDCRTSNFRGGLLFFSSIIFISCGSFVLKAFSFFVFVKNFHGVVGLLE
jgi:hypothetical protein